MKWKVCTHVAILKQGTLVAYGDVNEILVNEDIVEVAADDLNQLQSILQKDAWRNQCNIQRQICTGIF
jgi:ABC-type cobalamin/Fe3+-siderophores transport system ATPase subunit